MIALEWRHGARKRWVGWSALLILAALVCLLPGCSKKEWIPEEKKALYKAEIDNLPEKQVLKFKKINDFAWTNVVFTLNKEYIFSASEIPEGKREFVIDYEGFRHKDTGEPFPPDGEVWRIWIEGDEGYWY